MNRLILIGLFTFSSFVLVLGFQNCGPVYFISKPVPVKFEQSPSTLTEIPRPVILPSFLWTVSGTFPEQGIEKPFTVQLNLQNAIFYQNFDQILEDGKHRLKAEIFEVDRVTNDEKYLCPGGTLDSSQVPFGASDSSGITILKNLSCQFMVFGKKPSEVLATLGAVKLRITDRKANTVVETPLFDVEDKIKREWEIPVPILEVSVSDNADGKKVFKITVTNIQDFNNGIYFAPYNNGDQSCTSRILVFKFQAVDSIYERNCNVTNSDELNSTTKAEVTPEVQNSGVYIEIIDRFTGAAVFSAKTKP